MDSQPPRPNSFPVSWFSHTPPTAAIMGVVICSNREGQEHQKLAAQLTEKIEMGLASSGQQEVVMVTGGAGFLGQHIVKLISERATNVKEIRVFDTRPWRNKLGRYNNASKTQISSLVTPIVLVYVCRQLQ